MTTPLSFHERLVKLQTNLNAPKGNYNSFGKYNYRSCEDILSAAKPLLKELDLFLRLQDEIVQVGERYYVKATAILSSNGDTISASAFARESFDKKGMDDAQVTGSTSSYARKYALSGLLGIDDEEDADKTTTKPETNNVDRFKKETVKLDSYAIKVGKLKGRLFGELTKEELQESIEWATANISNPSQDWREFVNNAREYLR